MVWIDEKDFTRKGAAIKVSGNDAPDAARLRACAYERDGSRRKQELEVANRHAKASSIRSRDVADALRVNARSLHSQATALNAAFVSYRKEMA
jgi:hypothetical protein